jgi:hypothetical protein
MLNVDFFVYGADSQFVQQVSVPVGLRTTAAQVIAELPDQSAVSVYIAEASPTSQGLQRNPFAVVNPERRAVSPNAASRAHLHRAVQLAHASNRKPLVFCHCTIGLCVVLLCP